jgi:hypothetical protein
MFPYSFFDDFCDILERWCELFLFIVAQRDVIGDLAIISDGIHGIDKLEASFLVFAFLVEDASLIDDNIRVFLVSCIKYFIP